MRLPNKIAKKIYFTLQYMRNEPVEQVYSQLLVSQRYPLAQLKDLQWKRLLNLLNYAYKNSPFYQKIFKSVNLTPDDIKSINDFKKLPLLTKNDVQESFQLIKSKEIYNRNVTLASTSGSSGNPLKLLRDNESWANLHANIFKGLSWYGIDIGAPYAMVGGIGTGFKTMVKGALKDLTHNRIHLYAADMGTVKCSNFLKRILSFKAQYIYGYPTAIYDLACIAEQHHIGFNSSLLKIVLSHGEELEQYQKKKIEEIFKVPVINTFGCAEAGLIGFECPEGSFHIPIESIYLEIIDDSTVVTDLFSYSFPMIRYNLGDSLKISDKTCRCGREHPIFTDLKGKLRQVIELDNGRRVHTVFFNSLFKDLCHMGAPIKRYQIVRETPYQFVAKVICETQLDKTYVDFLRKTFIQRFGKSYSINLDIVSTIERSEGGKYRTYYEKYNS